MTTITPEELSAARQALRERSIDGRVGGATSYVQRRLRCGYNRAATIMEALEAEGFISAVDNTQGRILTEGADRPVPVHRSGP